MKTVVITNNVVEGFHQYKDAPSQVSFLRNPHRHLFMIECTFQVSHQDREIEIFIMQNKIDRFLRNTYGTPCIFGGMSCEHIAQAIIEHLIDDGCVSVIVREDGLGGGGAIL